MNWLHIIHIKENLSEISDRGYIIVHNSSLKLEILQNDLCWLK